MKLLRLLETSMTPSDNQRRQRIMNILLLGLILLVAVMVVYGLQFLFYTPLDVWLETAGQPVLLGVVLFVGLIPVLWLNRHRPKLAAQIFTALFTLALMFSDRPQEIVTGRVLFLLTTPIVFAALIIGSRWAWILASLINVLLLSLAVVNDLDLAEVVVNGLGLYFIALVAWLTTRSLEQSISELWALNTELDHRVAERTCELNESLAREQAEAAKTQAVITSIAEGVVVFDTDGKATVANPAFPILLGLDQNTILGHSFEELTHENLPDEEREAALMQMKKSTSSQDPNDALPFTRFQWREKTLLVSFAPMRDQDTREILGTVAVFHDFTHEAEVEAMKDRFLSMVSHELRTPLNAILGFADMLLESVYGPLNDNQRGVVARILSNSHRQLGIVNDLLDRAQMEAGRLILRSTPFSPAALLDELSGVMSTIAKAKHLELVTHLEDGVPATLHGDQQRLHQILVNLVTNAIKFTDKGVIGVRLYRPDPAHWALDVVDTGKGISPEAQKFIFDPFRQVDETATRTHRGVGLGLSIVKDLVSLMKGEIKLTSTPGKGSTFTITLPLVQAPEKESTP